MTWQTKKILCQIAATIWALFGLTFSLMSGAEDGIQGLLHNIPNAIPSLIFLGVVLLAWFRPFLGGWLLMLCAVVALFFFSAWNNLVVFILIFAFPLLTGLELTHAVNHTLFND